MDLIHDRSAFLPNLFYGDFPHLLIQKLKADVINAKEEQKTYTQNTSTCFLTEYLISPA